MTPTDPPFAEPKLFYVTWETRTILCFKAQERTLQDLLPDGWRVAPIPRGPAQRANFRMGFTDQLAIQHVDGVTGADLETPSRFVPQVISAIHETSTEPFFVVVGAWATSTTQIRFSYPRGGEGTGPREPDHATVERTVRTDPFGKTIAAETWEFTSSAGHSVRLDLRFERGKPALRDEELRIYPRKSAVDFYRNYRIENVEDIVYSRSAGVDRRRDYRFSCSGPIASLVFDGSEELVSIVSQPMSKAESAFPVGSNVGQTRRTSLAGIALCVAESAGKSYIERDLPTRDTAP